MTKLETMYASLTVQAKKAIAQQGILSNYPVDGETKNALTTLATMNTKRSKSINMDIALKIINAEQGNTNHTVCEVINAYLVRRIETLKEHGL